MGDYSYAYSEVLEVLKYLPKEDYDKIPKKLINILEANCDENCDFEYNVALSFDKQNLSKNAKVILAMLCKTCWQNEAEKEMLKELYAKNEAKQQEYLKQKYNYDNLFKNKEKVAEIKKESEEVTIVEYKKDTVFSKIKKMIKRIFKIK